MKQAFSILRPFYFSLGLALYFAFAATAASANETATVTLAGVVEDETGTPVSGARVRYLTSSDREFSTESHEDGSFALKVPEKSAAYGVFLADANDKLAYEQISFDLEKKIQTNAARLVLKPARRLKVIAKDETGQPASDARVFCISNYRTPSSDITDANGEGLLLVPQDAVLTAVVCLKPKVGFDYFLFRRKDQPISDPYQLAPNHSEPIEFNLNGARTVSVRVEDNRGEPLPDVRVYPWYFQKPRKGGDVNFGGLLGSVRTTGDNGLAVFDYIPTDNERPITFWARREGYYAPKRLMLNPESSQSELSITLVPMVRISGRVKKADGEPVLGISVLVSGRGYSIDGFRGATKSDADGEFEMLVNPNLYYQFSAGNDEWCSSANNYIILEAPIDDIEITLEKARRVFGQITMGEDRKPMAGAYVQLYQEPIVEYYKLPESEQLLPKPEDDNRAIMVRTARSVQTDAEGRFEFFAGPGDYYLICNDVEERPKFTIGDREVHEVNLHSDRPSERTITGRVVLQAGGPAKEAVVSGWGIEMFARRMNAVSDAEGGFTVTCGVGEMLVHAKSPDKQLAGIARLGADEERLEITIAPTASVRARIADEATDLPLAFRQITYGVQLEHKDGTFSTHFGGTAISDEEGRFEIEGLVVGQEYRISVVTKTTLKGEPRGWREVAKMTPDRSGDIDWPPINVNGLDFPPTILPEEP